MIKDTDNMTDPRITETELTGSYFERPCPCGVDDCDCRQIADEQKEEQLRDDELFKENRR